MRLDGTLTDYPLSDLLQLVFMGKRSGTLRIHTGDQEGILVFGDNMIRFARSSENKGLKAIKQVLGWEKGKFVFDTEESPDLGEDSKINLPIQQFVLEASAEIDESEDLLGKIGGRDRRLMLVPYAPKEKQITLTPAEWRVVAHLGDAPRLGELQSRLSVSERDLLRAIVDLRDRGLLTIE